MGRKSSCHVQVKHAAISGLHCTLTHLPDSALTFLTDHSTNGTWVDGKKAEKGRRVRVSNGSEILFIRNADEKISYHIYHTSTPSAQGRDSERGGPFDKYEVKDETLGTGAFAVVKVCVERDTGRRYAMKIIEKKKFALNHGSRRGNAILDEVKILQRLNHPHIIQIHDVYDTDKYLYLVLELVTGGDLFDAIIQQNGKGFPEPRSAHIFQQVLDATSYLHDHNIVHRDLKPENSRPTRAAARGGEPSSWDTLPSSATDLRLCASAVLRSVLLCTPDGDTIKLSDFGLSRMIGEGSTMKTLCGTPQYLAPEVLNEQLSVKGYDKAVDLWSLGVILYVLLTGMAPFNENKNLIDEVKNGRYSFPAQHWATKSRSSIALIRGLLTMDPAKRWTVEQVRHSEWMRTQQAALGLGAGLGLLMPGPASTSSAASTPTSAAAPQATGRKRSGPGQRGADAKKAKVGEEEKGEEAVTSRRGRSSRPR